MLKPTLLRRLVRTLTAGAGLLMPWSASAAVYGGCGLSCGIAPFAGLGGISGVTSIKTLIVILILFLLDIVLFVAIGAVIVAGIYLIVSNGDEGQKDKAKTIVLYAIAGIALIIMSRVIVVFVNNLLG